MEMTNVGNLLELRRIYSRGITGKGITTAVLDTGIYAHPDFFIPQNKILYFQDFVRNRRGPFDDNGHGTHVSGIIASGGRFGDGSGIGVAPESSIVMLKVLERDGSGKIKNMIKGMEWICLNHKKYGIRIVNISVGMPVKNVENPDEDILVKKVEELWNAGLVVVVAAGNDGRHHIRLQAREQAGKLLLLEPEQKQAENILGRVLYLEAVSVSLTSLRQLPIF